MKTPAPDPAARTAASSPTHPPLAGSAHLVMIVPHEEEERQAAAMETWLQACATDEPFALELVGTRDEQGFVLRASSAHHLQILSAQLSAQYPQADIIPISPAADPLLLRQGEHALIGTFALAQPAWMPLKTFTGKALVEPGGDPLVGILHAMDAAGPGQRIVAQLALERAPDHWISRHLRKSVEHPLQEERDARQASTRERGVPSDLAQGTRLLLLLLLAGAASAAVHWYATRAWGLLVLLALALLCAGIGLLWWRARHSHQDIYDMKLVADKLLRTAYYTQLRVIVIGQQQTSTRADLRVHLAALQAAYQQLTLASANSLSLKRIRSLQAVHKRAAQLTIPRCAFPYAHWLLRLLMGAPGKDVWNSLELVGAYHLPQPGASLPRVRRLLVKYLPASREIARQVREASAPLPPARIGWSGRGQSRVPVLLPYRTLTGHKLACGKSRSGKSALMLLLLAAAMRRACPGAIQPGVFVIDPHHDLIRDLLLLVPPDRINEVLLFDLTATAFPVALNPLDASMGFSRDQAIANLIASCKQVWADYWGPRMEYFLRNVFLLLSTLNERLVREGKADEQYTLLDVNPILQYENYALRVLEQLDPTQSWDRELLAWWQNTYFRLPRDSSFRQEVILPILSKLGVFSDNQQLRRIVGQPVTRIPLHEAITSGKIVLCALSSRDMDDTAVNILGSTLINLMRRSFRLQESAPLGGRRKVFVAIDEFQAFSGADIGKLLSEDAKFGCAMMLSTQYLKQLNTFKEGLLETVLGNCENLFAFNLSAADARLLEAELQEKVSQKHLISQPRMQCYARLTIEGHPLQVVSVTLDDPACWRPTPAMVTAAERIQQQNPAAVTSADAVDRQHERHLDHFLQLDLFATRIAQKAQKRSRNGMQQQRQRNTPAAVPPSPPLPPPAPLAQAAPIPVVSDGTQDQTAPPPPEGCGGGQADDPAEARRHSHPRSRRRQRLTALNKTPVGAPPPLLPSEDEGTHEGSSEPHPLPPTVGRGRGKEGRERERG